MTGNLWEFPAEGSRGLPSWTEYVMVLRHEDQRLGQQLLPGPINKESQATELE